MNDNNVNHQISLQEAVDMTTRYRQNQPSNFPQYESFDVEAVRALIASDQCAFLRIYFGMKENNQVDLILVAADAQGQDLLPSSTESTEDGDDNLILEDGFRCPQFCPSNSVLAGN